jgi:disulfide bond formation protein DsbB
MSNDLAIEIRATRFFVCVVIISLLVLTISYSAEFVFQKLPCQLCKLERLPYCGMLVVSLLGFANINKKIILPILFGICLISSAFGAYHWGIQQNIFKDFCAVVAVSTIDDFQNLLNSPACSKVGFAVFGIPATLMNFFISLCILVSTYFRLNE